MIILPNENSDDGESNVNVLKKRIEQEAAAANVLEKKLELFEKDINDLILLKDVVSQMKKDLIQIERKMLPQKILLEKIESSSETDETIASKIRESAESERQLKDEFEKLRIQIKDMTKTHIETHIQQIEEKLFFKGNTSIDDVEKIIAERMTKFKSKIDKELSIFWDNVLDRLETEVKTTIVRTMRESHVFRKYTYEMSDLRKQFQALDVEVSSFSKQINTLSKKLDNIGADFHKKTENNDTSSDPVPVMYHRYNNELNDDFKALSSIRKSFNIK